MSAIKRKPKSQSRAGSRRRAPHDSSPIKDKAKRFRIPAHQPKAGFSPMLVRREDTRNAPGTFVPIEDAA